MNGNSSRSGRRTAYRHQNLIRREMTAIGLPDFETADHCITRNQQMRRRLQNHLARPPELVSRIELDPLLAGDDSHLGYDGNWLASRRYRAMLIPQAYDLLKDHPGPLFFVTVAHPKWELPVGQLEDANIDAAKQWLGRRLKTLPAPVIVVGGFEASISIELDRHTFWAGHLHIVVAGATRLQLKEALAIEKHYRHRTYAKPVTVVAVGNLARQLGYATKRIAKRGVAYIGDNGRQQRRKILLTAGEQTEFDLWLLRLPAGSRTVLFGCRLHHGQLRLTKNSTKTDGH